MRIFKNKWFARYQRRAGIEDAALCQAVRELSQGQCDADLGAGVFKQRVARPGAGKSGGFRVIVLFKFGDCAFFVYGFAKSARGNISEDELKVFKKLALEVLGYNNAALAKAVTEEAFTEVIC